MVGFNTVAIAGFFKGEIFMNQYIAIFVKNLSSKCLLKNLMFITISAL